MDRTNKRMLKLKLILYLFLSITKRFGLRQVFSNHIINNKIHKRKHTSQNTQQI